MNIRDTFYAGCADGSVWKVFGNRKFNILPSNAVNKQADIVQSLFIDNKSNLWVGRNYTVVKLNRAGLSKLIPFKEREGLGTYHFLEHKTGFYISNETGMFKLEGDSIFSPFKELINAKHAFKYADFDRYDRLWFAEDGKGLGLLFKNGDIKYLNSTEHLPITEIRSINLEKNNKVAWVQFLGGILKVEYSINGVENVKSFAYDYSGFTSLHSNATYFSDTLFSVDQNKLVYNNRSNLNVEPIKSFNIINLNDTINQIVLPTYLNLENQQLNLNKGGGVFAISINAINYASEVPLLYKFTFKGEDINIMTIQESNYFNLGFLAPGTYTLDVQVAENEIMFKGVKKYSLILIVPAFWYQTLWAKGLIISLFILLIYFTVLFIQRRRLLRKQIQFENEKSRIDLENKVLRSQLDPHLVFNLLNNIQSNLLFGTRDHAVEKLSKLSTFLRDSLLISNRSNITLNEEINYIKDYLKFKLGDKPEIKIDFNESILNVFGESLIPGLLWQPLIENAVKYCDGHVKFISVVFYIDNENVVGEIRNSVSQSIKMHDESGNGLRLVKDRINLINKLYGNESAFFLFERINGQFKSNIILSKKIL